MDELIVSLPSGIQALYSSKELHDYANAFLKADVDNSGELDLNELKGVVETLPNDLGDVIPLDDMENMLKLMDLNNDGLVSFEEMLCCIAAIVYVQDDLIAEAYNARNIASFVDSIWEEYDENNNGDLDPSEIKLLFQDYITSKNNITNEECEFFVSSIDEDDNGTIEKSELIHFIARGTKLSDKQRNAYMKRGGAQKYIIEFFDSIQKQMNVRAFLLEIWPQYDDAKVGYLTPKQTKQLIERFTKSEISEKDCKHFINSIDEDRNNKIEKKELRKFIGKGIDMDESQRERFESRGESQKTIVKFFNACEKHMKRKFDSSIFEKSFSKTTFVLPKNKANHLLFDTNDMPKQEMQNPHLYKSRFFADLYDHNSNQSKNVSNSNDTKMKVYFLDRSYAHVNINDFMTVKNVCVAMKDKLKLQNDEDFALYLYNSTNDEMNDATMLRKLNDEEYINTIAKDISDGPFDIGENVNVSPIDINENVNHFVTSFLKKEWYKFNNSLKPLKPKQLKVLFDYYTQHDTPEDMCHAFVEHIDTDHNAELSLEELAEYITNGIEMSIADRKEFASRNYANEILISFFNAIELCIYSEKVDAVIVECVKVGNKHVRNGKYKVEYFDKKLQTKVRKVIAERWIKRFGKIVYRRKIVFISSNFEDEATGYDKEYTAAHRLLFAEYYDRYLCDYYKSSIGDAIEFGTLLLLIDLIGYPHANLTSSNLFSYGNGMGPYLPKRILNQFREVKKLDVLAQRIKTEAMKTLNEIRNHQQSNNNNDLQFNNDKIFLAKTGKGAGNSNNAIDFNDLQFIDLQFKIERMFINKCMKCYPKIHDDRYFHVQILENDSLIRGQEDSLFDVLSQPSWYKASVGFGKEALHIVTFKANSMSIDYVLRYGSLYRWQRAVHGTILRVWYGDNHGLTIKTSLAKEMEDTINSYITELVGIRDTGERVSKARSYHQKELKILFEKFDQDNSNYLDRHEVRQMLVTLGRQSTSEDMLTDVINKMDTDQNGEIEFDEFCAWWDYGGANENAELTSRRVSQLKIQKSLSSSQETSGDDVDWVCMKMIQRHDPKHTGELSPKQLKSLFEDLTNQHVSKSDCQKFIASLDTDGDGKIQRNELIDFVRSGIAMSERERAVYKSRGGAQSIIIEFFDSIKEKIKVRHFIQNIWTKYDITSTGYLTPSEVKVFIQEFSQKEITEEECEYFINSIDENQDSKIDREELIEFVLTGLSMNEKQKSIYASRGKTQVTVIEFFEATRKYVMNPDRYREDMSKLVVNNGQEEIKLNASHDSNTTNNNGQEERKSNNHSSTIHGHNDLQTQSSRGEKTAEDIDETKVEKNANNDDSSSSSSSSESSSESESESPQNEEQDTKQKGSLEQSDENSAMENGHTRRLSAPLSPSVKDVEQKKVSSTRTTSNVSDSKEENITTYNDNDYNDDDDNKFAEANTIHGSKVETNNSSNDNINTTDVDNASNNNNYNSNEQHHKLERINKKSKKKRKHKKHKKHRKKSNDKQEEAEKNSNDFNLFESLGLCGSSRF